MRVTTIHEGPELSVYGCRCDAGPHEKPFPEVHRRHSLALVRRGSFGCRTLGQSLELVAGAVMVGRPCQEYTAMHEHHGRGDECISLKLSPALAESLGEEVWRSPRVPPLAPLMVAGTLVQAASEGRSDVGADEAALAFAHKLAEVMRGEKAELLPATAADRRRAVGAALRIDENPAEETGLEALARAAGVSPFHFLRVFARVTGVTPHQYRLRSRLRRAAMLLAEGGLPVTEVALEAGFADLSNFVRSFHRAAGASPREFRRTARGKILQEAIARAA
jgi:AraC family transcriptional regulator